MEGPRRLVAPLALSALIHASGLLLVRPPSPEPAHPPPWIELEVLPPPPAPPPRAPHQIVTPPDVINDREPTRPRFLSDRSTTTPEESVRSGAPARPAAGASNSGSPTSPQPPTARLPRRALFVPTREARTAPWARSPTTDATPRRDLAALPPSSERWIDFGRPGVLDHLPDIRQGKLTLLNTKADRFAPFVRRVGLRVFENLLILQRRHLEGNGLAAAQGFVRVEAILSPQGELSSLNVLASSGSSSLDAALLDACQVAAWDHNPPSGVVLADGNIHFIFHARLRAWLGSGGSAVARYESYLGVELL